MTERPETNINDTIQVTSQVNPPGSSSSQESGNIPHIVCHGHLVYPCNKVMCPMYQYRELFMWLVKRETDARWTQLPLAMMHHLEVEYMDPAITETSINWEGRDVKVLFKNYSIETRIGSGLSIRRL